MTRVYTKIFVSTIWVMYFCICIYSQSDPVSVVNTDGDKPAIYVKPKGGGGLQPFFYNAVQISAQRLKYQTKSSWTNEEIANLIKRASEDGFTVVCYPIRWDKIFPEQNLSELDELRSAIQAASTNGIKLEISWFGSDICGEFNHVPKWVSSVCGPSHVQGIRENGSHYDTSFPYVYYDEETNSWITETLYKYCKNNTRIIDEERKAIEKLMNSIQIIANEQTNSEADHYPVIGILLGNEPTMLTYEFKYTADSQHRDRGEESGQPQITRCHCKYCDDDYAKGKLTQRKDGSWVWKKYTSDNEFNRDRMWEFYNHLSSAVKQSGYSVYTRTNFAELAEMDLLVGSTKFVPALVAYNEKKKEDSPNTCYWDFLGYDPYGSSPDYIYKYCQSSEIKQKKNLVMVMENSGSIGDTPILMFNALAGDGLYHIWEYCDSKNDSNYGIYGIDPTNPKKLIDKGHAAKIRQYNEFVKKDAYDLAINSALIGTKMRLFNRLFKMNADETKKIDDINIRYFSLSGGGGIAISRESENQKAFIFMSSEKTGKFLVPAGICDLENAKQGSFDGNNFWQDDDNVTVKTESFGAEDMIEVPANKCVRVLRINSQPPSSNVSLKNSGFEDNPTEQIVLLNSGFENDSLGWSVEGDSGAVYVTTTPNAHGGNKQLNVWRSTAYKTYVYQTINSLNTSFYNISAWVISSGGQNICQLEASGYDQYNPEAKTVVTLPLAQSGWTEVKIRNLYVTSGSCKIGFRSDASDGLWMVADDVEMIKVNRTPDQWESDGVAAYLGDSDSGEPHGGLYQLVHWSGSNYDVRTSQTIENLTTGLYKLSAWVRSSGGQNETVMEFCESNGSGTTLNRYQYNIPKCLEWTKVEIDAISLAGGNTHTVSFHSVGNSNNWLVIDDVEFAQSSCPTGCSITNPGFEESTNPDGWSTNTNNPSAVYVETSYLQGYSHSGRRRLVHYANTGFNAYTYQTRAGLFSGVYSLSAWVRSSSNAGSSGLSCKMKASGYDSDRNQETYCYSPTPELWTLFRISAVNVKSQKCEFGFQTEGNNSWSVYDDISMSMNLVSDGGFEEEPLSPMMNSWQIEGASMFEKAENYIAPAHSGSYHANHFYRNGSSQARTYQIIQNVPSGKTYTLRAWVISNSGNHQMYVTGSAPITITPSLSWKQIEISNISANGSVEIGFSSTGLSAGTATECGPYLLIDDVEFVSNIE